jgi:hypothetical protein
VSARKSPRQDAVEYEPQGRRSTAFRIRFSDTTGYIAICAAGLRTRRASFLRLALWPGGMVTRRWGRDGDMGS